MDTTLSAEEKFARFKVCAETLKRRQHILTMSSALGLGVCLLCSSRYRFSDSVRPDGGYHHRESAYHRRYEQRR